MQIQPYNQGEAPSKAFSIVLYGNRAKGQPKPPVEIDIDNDFNHAIETARTFPIMPHERLTVYRGVYGKETGLREVYTRIGKRHTF